MENDGGGGGWVLYPPLSGAETETPWWYDAAAFLLPLGNWIWLIALALLIGAVTAFFGKRVFLGAVLIIASTLFGIVGVIGVTELEQDVGTTFFDPKGSQTSANYQHIRWILGQPEIYGATLKIVLLVIGSVWVVKAMLRRRMKMAIAVFVVAASTLAVWHGLATQYAFETYRQGMALREWGKLPFWISSFLALSVPVAGLVIHRRSVSKNPVGLLFLVSGIVFMAVGWILTYRLANAGVDQALHDTYYVMAHTRYVLIVLAGFAVFALAYFGFRWLVGVPYNRWIGGAHLLCWTGGIGLSTLPQFFFANEGMPRRYDELSDIAGSWQTTSIIGSALVLVSLALFAAVIIEGVIRRFRSSSPEDAGQT